MPYYQCPKCQHQQSVPSHEPSLDLACHMCGTRLSAMNYNSAPTASDENHRLIDVITDLTKENRELKKSYDQLLEHYEQIKTEVDEIYKEKTGDVNARDLVTLVDYLLDQIASLKVENHIPPYVDHEAL
jgi:hypothetical protein